VRTTSRRSLLNSNHVPCPYTSTRTYINHPKRKNFPLPSRSSFKLPKPPSSKQERTLSIKRTSSVLQLSLTIPSTMHFLVQDKKSLSPILFKDWSCAWLAVMHRNTIQNHPVPITIELPSTLTPKRIKRISNHLASFHPLYMSKKTSNRDTFNKLKSISCSTDVSSSNSST
jgi:hypothetical protein